MSNNNTKNDSNFIVSFLYLSSSFLAIYAVVAYIAQLFGYKLRVSGADMPTLDLISAIFCLLIASIMYGIGYYFDSSHK